MESRAVFQAKTKANFFSLLNCFPGLGQHGPVLHHGEVEVLVQHQRHHVPVDDEQVAQERQEHGVEARRVLGGNSTGLKNHPRGQESN